MASERKNAWRAGALALIAAVALVSGAPVFAQSNDVTIMVDWAPQGMHAGLHLAVQKGWFNDAGLNVKVLDGKGSSATIQQVAARQIDVGFAQLGAMAPAVSNGMPVIAVMGLVQAGDNGLLVPQSAGFKKVTDLKGKRIAVPNGGAVAPFLDAVLRNGGLNRREVEVINVDPQAMINLYSAGRVDAALSTVAGFAPIVADVRPSTGIMFSDVGLHIPGFGLLVNKEAIAKRPDMVSKVVAVNKRVWEYIFSGKQEEAIDAIVAQRPGMRLDRKVLLGQLEMFMPLFQTPATRGKPLGWESDDDWKAALQAMQDAGTVKAGWDTKNFYTNQFIPN